MKITNKQENKIFKNEEEFLKFVAATGCTPHASIKGVYVGIARIAQENKATAFTTNKSCEKATIQEKIDNLLKSTREENLYTSWQAFKNSFEESKQENLKEFDSKFDGNFYFVKLSSLTVDNYSKYGMIQNSKSIVIFEILNSSDVTRIDLDHKEIFCIDRQFGNDTTHTATKKNGKCEIKRNFSQFKTEVNITKALWYALNNEELYTSYKNEILQNITEEIDNMLNSEFDRIEKEKEEKRIKEENKRKQKEAQQKAKQEAKEKEIRDSVTEGIIANILANNPNLTREQVIKMIS